MTRDEVFDAVVGILRRTFRDPELQVSENTTAADVEGWTSLTHATLLLRLEKHFNTRIPDEAAYKVEDVGQLVQAILASMAEE